MKGYTADAWLRIASGGRWSIAEVQQACPGRDPKLIQNAVRSMEAAGMVRRYEDGRKVFYGVTSDCTIPRGLTLADVGPVLGVSA
jgi:hypothetical protein